MKNLIRRLMGKKPVYRVKAWNTEQKPIFGLWITKDTCGLNLKEFN